MKSDDFIISFDDLGSDIGLSNDVEANSNDVTTNDDSMVKDTDTSEDIFLYDIDDDEDDNECSIFIDDNDSNQNKACFIDDENNSIRVADTIPVLDTKNKDEVSEKDLDVEALNSESISTEVETEEEVKVEEKPKYGKYNKKQIQTLIFGLIAILFIASLMTFGFMIKGSNNINTTTSSTSEVSELNFILNVVSKSNKTSLDYYNDLKEVSLSNKINLSKVQEISKLAKDNLKEIYSLGEYINVGPYDGIVEELESRYSNIIELCNELYSKNANEYKSLYNKYVREEIEIIDRLNNEITKKLDYFAIPYEIKDNSIVFQG